MSTIERSKIIRVILGASYYIFDGFADLEGNKVFKEGMMSDGRYDPFGI